MAMQGLPTFLTIPSNYNSLAGSNTLLGTNTVTAINGTTIKVALRINIPFSGTLTGLTFYTGTVTVAATINVRLETENSSTGYPSGTLYNANATASQASPAATTSYTVTFASSFSVTQGDTIYVVWECPSGSPNLSIAVNTTLSTSSLSVMSNFSGLPVTSITYNGSAWTFAATPGIGNLGLVYSGITPKVIGSNFTMGLNSTFGATTSVAIDSSRAATQIGYKLNLPYGARLCGVSIYADQDADGLIQLYNSALDTSLSSITLKTNVPVSTAVIKNTVYFSSPIDLSANTDYYLTFNGNGNTTCLLYKKTIPTYYTSWLYNNDFTQQILTPGTINTLSPTSTANWTNLTDGTLPLIQGLFSHIDIPTGGGGGVPFSASW